MTRNSAVLRLGDPVPSSPEDSGPPSTTPPAGKSLQELAQRYDGRPHGRPRRPVLPRLRRTPESHGLRSGDLLRRRPQRRHQAPGRRAPALLPGRRPPRGRGSLRGHGIRREQALCPRSRWSDPGLEGAPGGLQARRRRRSAVVGTTSKNVCGAFPGPISRDGENLPCRHGSYSSPLLKLTPIPFAP
jgi:hypothetical protein